MHPTHPNEVHPALAQQLLTARMSTHKRQVIAACLLVVTLFVFLLEFMQAAAALEAASPASQDTAVPLPASGASAEPLSLTV